ncbi:DUF4270 family protein [Brumimicrobium mesophilum]|uniref:DUF4270 family protein n=1 Tax=Brumimicrobium mesophilum TaxID=392717 RepID=UPI000D140483|nr:DUF4270 family protein [Brumimicrobium mesophilum]
MMIQNTTNYTLKKWRKVILLFAAFFCLSITISSCKKKRNPVGASALSSENIMGSDVIDTFQLKTYTIEEDSIYSMDPSFNLLGSYNDEVYGKVDASFYTQLTLSGFSPDFGDLSTVVIDSAVMAFEFGGYYGDISEQLFEVYEITDELTRDSSYTRSSVASVGTEQLVPTVNGEGLITPDPLKNAVVGNDTLNPQLRIPLDTVFARNMLSIAENSTSDADFLQSFKGLHFKVNNSFQSPGEGTILYLSSTLPASKMTVYYTANGEQGSYDFLITGSAIDFNNVVTDYSGTRVEQVINDNDLGQTEFYAQAFSTRAKIDFSSIDSLPKNIIIQKATLELPVSYYQGSNFYPSSDVRVSSEILGDGKKYVVSETENVSFNSTRKSYVINLRTYIQQIVLGEAPNSGIFVSPTKFNTTAERILFNGSDTPNKNKPKLSIVYTVL